MSRLRRSDQKQYNQPHQQARGGGDDSGGGDPSAQNYEDDLQVRLVAMLTSTHNGNRNHRKACIALVNANFPDYGYCGQHRCVVEALPQLDILASAEVADSSTTQIPSKYLACNKCPRDGTSAFSWTAPRVSGPEDIVRVRDDWVTTHNNLLDDVEADMASSSTMGGGGSSRAVIVAAMNERQAFHRYTLVIHDVVGRRVRAVYKNTLARGPSHGVYVDLLREYEVDAHGRRRHAGEATLKAWCYQHGRPGHALASAGDQHKFDRACWVCPTAAEEPHSSLIQERPPPRTYDLDELTRAFRPPAPPPRPDTPPPLHQEQKDEDDPMLTGGDGGGYY